MENDGKDKKDKKDKKKSKTADGAELQTDGRLSRARSAVSSGASRVASTVSNNKKSLGLGAAAAAVAAAGVVAVVKRRKTALKTTTPEAPAETSLLDATPAETSGLRGV
jgi:hypothetical protein